MAPASAPRKDFVWIKPYLGGIAIELRRLRYFVAVADGGNFTRAGEKRLHTAQPSLSRQIRDLEAMLKVPLIVREPRGTSLTPAGQVFLGHARLILAQADAAIEAARRAHKPAKTRFTVGFLTGYEIGWLPRVPRALDDQLETIELIIHSASSPELLEALVREQMDIAFVRPDASIQELRFWPLIDEELFVLLPADHEMARRHAIRVGDIANEPFIAISASYSPLLRSVIEAFLGHHGVHPTPVHEAETLPMVISFILSSRGVTLLPEYMRGLLPGSVVASPLEGTPPTIPLALCHNRSNTSPLPRLLLSRTVDITPSAP